MTPTENSASQVRTWQEEADMLISLLNCFAPEREAVFASSESLTGKRFYDLCLELEVKTSEELEKKLGPEYSNRLLTGDSGRCRSVFRGMPITDSALMAITIPG
jgi:hypothetical protein